MSLQCSSQNLADYLKSDEVIDWDNDRIRDTVRSITGKLPSPERGTSGPGRGGEGGSDVGQSRALFEWVRDAIPHTSDADRQEVTCAASEVLALGTGICYAKAHLLAAMLRASGIPAGFCYQVYWDEIAADPGVMSLHGLNGVYLESLGRWIRLDARGNKNGVDAQFDVNTERLAFPDDAFLDDVIYADPLPSVVSALRSASTHSELWPHLPSVRMR